MGLFGKSNLIEWLEFRDDILLYRYHGEVKKHSRIILRPGQAAIVFDCGRLEKIFDSPGEFAVGIHNARSIDVLFVNTKEITMTWGTKNPILVRFGDAPQGVLIRGFGSYLMKFDDVANVVEKISGISELYTVEDVRKRVDMVLDSLLMVHLSREGKCLANLQSNADDICKAVQIDLDMELIKIGLTVSQFKAQSFSCAE